MDDPNDNPPVLEILVFWLPLILVIIVGCSVASAFLFNILRLFQ